MNVRAYATICATDYGKIKSMCGADTLFAKFA